MPTGARIVFKSKINAVITDSMKDRLNVLRQRDGVHEADVIRLAIDVGLNRIEDWSTDARLTGYRAQTPPQEEAPRLPRRLSREARAELLAARLDPVRAADARRVLDALNAPFVAPTLTDPVESAS
jgi:hypothetical protein